MHALQPYKIFDTLNVQMGNNNQTVGNKGCFGSRINGTQKFSLKDSNNSETLTLDDHSRMMNITISLSSCGRERQEARHTRQKAAADKIIEILNNEYGVTAVIGALARAQINPGRGLRLNEVVQLAEFLEPESKPSLKGHHSGHHSKQKTVHPLPTTTTSTPSSDGSSSSASETTAQKDKVPTLTDSPPTTTSGDSNIDATGVKKSDEKSARNIIDHFIQQSHSIDISRENVIGMINEEYQSSGMIKGQIAYSHSLIENIQRELQNTLKNSIVGKEIDPRDQNTQISQLRSNRRICLLNTALLSIMLEEKGKSLLETKKMAQDIIGTIIINCPSQTITYELVHDLVVKAITQGTKFEYNGKMPYYLSDALSDFLMDKSTSIEEKLPFLKRFTALNTLLTSPDTLHKFQNLGCLSSPPELINKSPLPNIHTIESKTPILPTPKTIKFEELELGSPAETPQQPSRIVLPPAHVIYSQHPLHGRPASTVLYTHHPLYYNK